MKKTLSIIALVTFFQLNSIAQEITQNLHSVFFIDDQTGWIVGDSGVILKSDDGGVSWIQQSTPTYKNYSCVHFIDNMNGWTVCFGGVMIKTQDGGMNWQIIGSGENYALQTVQFFDENLGWAAGFPEILLRSEDGGINWDTIQQNVAGTIMSLAFSDAQNGWYVTAGGKIYHSEDSGLNWAEQTSCSGNMLYDLCFINDSTGWIAANYDPFAGNYRNILYSSNGGSVWNCVEVTISGMVYPGFHSVDFVNDIKGWAVGENGNIIHSNDGGISWTWQNSGVTEWLTSVDFINEYYGWAVGLNGTILRTIDGGITWNPIIVKIEDYKYSMNLQIWPTPTNGTIYIDFGTKRKFEGIIQIHSTKSSVVYRSEYKSSMGTVISINMSDYPAGLYLLSVITDKGQKFQSKIIVQ